VGALASNNTLGSAYWNGWSAQGLMLSYLEQTAVYNAINFMLDPLVNNSGPFNSTALYTKINSFLCPSDGFAGQNFINSYYASQGCSVQNTPTMGSGIFVYNNAFNISTVTDGTSNTVAFSEGLVGNGTSTGYPGNGVVGAGAGFSPNTDANTTAAITTQTISNIQACSQAFIANSKSGSNMSGNRGWYWGWGAESMSMFNTLVPPSSTQYKFNQCRYGCGGCGAYSADHSDITNASSSHPGGANVLFADGSVKFIKNSIAMKIWWSIGTKNLGEVVSSDSY